MEIEEVEEARRGRREIGTTVTNADTGEQRQEQYVRIKLGIYREAKLSYAMLCFNVAFGGNSSIRMFRSNICGFPP